MAMLLSYGGDGRHDFNLNIDVSNVPERAEALKKISRPVAGVHRRAKQIPPDTVAQALNNQPFEDYPRAVYAWKQMCEKGDGARKQFDQSYERAVEGFLRQIYHILTYIPEISFSIGGEYDYAKESSALDRAMKSYAKLSIGNQIDSLRSAYKGLCGLRIVFDNARERGGFSVETVLPSRYLPELLMAAPVWFIKPNLSVVKYFCDLGITEQFAYLFQMYNQVPMSLESFSGQDIMPLPIAELVGKVNEFFDYLVIATPYHDLASQQWRDSSWKRNIDPFLFGFLKQVPELMFFLGRWSGTGLFPLVTDMIADTIEHIRKNKGLLANFGGSNWYKEETDTKERTKWYDVVKVMNAPLLKPSSYYMPVIPKYCADWEKWKEENHTLVKFADNVLQHYDQGKLFSWLRGEYQVESSPPFSVHKALKSLFGKFYQ